MRPNHKPWKLKDLNILRALLMAGRPIPLIAWAMDRTEIAINTKIHRLGWTTRKLVRQDCFTKTSVKGVLTVRSKADVKRERRKSPTGKNDLRDLRRARRIASSRQC